MRQRRPILKSMLSRQTNPAIPDIQLDLSALQQPQFQLPLAPAPAQVASPSGMMPPPRLRPVHPIRRAMLGWEDWFPATSFNARPPEISDDSGWVYYPGSGTTGWLYRAGHNVAEAVRILGTAQGGPTGLLVNVSPELVDFSSPLQPHRQPSTRFYFPGY